MGAGSFQHRAAQRGVGARIGNDLHHDALNDGIFIAAHGDLDVHGVTLGVDQDAFRAAQLHLDRSAGEIGHQCRVVLDGHILLAAEAAAHQHILHPNLLIGQTQHGRGLVLGVVGALVGGEDLHMAVLHEGHGTFRLQEGMLGPRCAEFILQNIFRLGDGRFRIAAADVFQRQQVSVLMD